jgi:hypothetical protein
MIVLSHKPVAAERQSSLNPAPLVGYGLAALVSAAVWGGLIMTVLRATNAN